MHWVGGLAEGDRAAGQGDEQRRDRAGQRGEDRQPVRDGQPPALEARSAATAGSRPKANVSRPVYRLVAVAAPNHSEPSHACSPNSASAGSVE